MPHRRSLVAPPLVLLLACSLGALPGCDAEPAGTAAGDTADAAGDSLDDGAADGAEDALVDAPSALCAHVPGGCEGPGDVPRVSAPAVVVPSAGLPPELVVQNANNNLDVIWFQGRAFLAFRTAPTHFAAPDVQLQVVSSADLVSWRFEGTFDLDTDLREPNLAVTGDTLHLYYAILGDQMADFTPQGTQHAEYVSPGVWTPAEDIFPDGSIVWRIKEHDGLLYGLGYTGGENIYDVGGDPIRVFVLTSSDGRDWAPLSPPDGVILEGGCSETDFVPLEGGEVLVVCRNEAGENGRFGSRVCRGRLEDPAAWRCEYDPRKYDSPLMLSHGGRHRLVGRRNVTDTGAYDLERVGIDMADEFLAYSADYWTRPKRCALWEVDPDSLQVTWTLDLPSAGDTCFPEALDVGPGRHLVFNYSSPLDDPEISWIDGQMGPTQVSWVELVLP